MHLRQLIRGKIRNVFCQPRSLIVKAFIRVLNARFGNV